MSARSAMAAASCGEERVGQRPLARLGEQALPPRRRPFDAAGRRRRDRERAEFLAHRRAR